MYPSDVSDAEWQLLAPLIPGAKPGGHPRMVAMRSILNGIFYELRSGCAWRLLPHEYGPWQTIYGYFRRWRRDGHVVALGHGRLCHIRASSDLRATARTHTNGSLEVAGRS